MSGSTHTCVKRDKIYSSGAALKEIRKEAYPLLERFCGAKTLRGTGSATWGVWQQTILRSDDDWHHMLLLLCVVVGVVVVL